MRGYWDDPERTREAIDAGGWMHTGDLGVIDEEGYCNIVGRVKDMIIRGGENISPREIEEFLYRHPAVLDVAVVGVPDPKYGEAVCACIRLRPGVAVTEEDIQEFCRGQIAHYKVPRYVRFVDGFPLTVSGKVQKYLIREQSARRARSLRGAACVRHEVLVLGAGPAGSAVGAPARLVGCSRRARRCGAAAGTRGHIRSQPRAAGRGGHRGRRRASERAGHPARTLGRP